ncbi:SDR family oxidoreductase [Gryllotalpicola sp.]|uniref:SDR family oxidoreductase n=1 Tax=Gryllotalpicola sp. TaxID=1932787 RepID=UPI0026345910|nr:SDR family oxidoreductase [Gryllotalpicola sp.]
MVSRRAVVTGASSGIGEATARALVASGWDVVGVARRAERLERLAAETGAAMFAADIAEQGDVDALRGFLAESGPVHALVNIAGGARGMASVEAGSIDDWRWMFEVNVLGTKRMVTALLPLLRAGAGEAGGHADILTVTSTAGHQAYANGGGYNAAKFAEHALVAALRLELLGEPIRVMEVAPGLVETAEFALRRFGGDAERAAATYAGVDDPLDADDVAAVIAGALNQPGHVNQDLIVLRPVAQGPNQLLHRGPVQVVTGNPGA